MSYQSMPKWFRTKKNTGWSISLQTPFVREQTEKFLKSLGNPYGLFIGYGRQFEYGRLYLMDNFKGDRVQVRDKMIEIYQEQKYGAMIVRIKERMMEKLQEKIDELPEDQRTDEKIKEIIHQSML